MLRAKAGHRIYIAHITAVEITSAITRRQRGGHLSTAQGGAILGHFRRHLTQRYRVVELTPVLLDKSTLIARKHGLRAYDAVQLTVALEVQQLRRIAGIGPVTMVSSDHELNVAASAEGLVVENPTTH